MDTDILHAVSQYAQEVLGNEGFRYASAVVANCKMLALQIEAEEEAAPAINTEALVLAAYLHDIAVVSSGFKDHHRKSAEMAVEFLKQQKAPSELVELVEQIILIHTTSVPEGERESVPIEGLILYDADKLGRLSGLAVVTSLIELGERYPHRAANSDLLAAVLRHIEERFIELYQSLHTQPARELARDKFNRTLAFLDGVIEHLSDATPV
ncbi:HD superfamily phosphodiesterase [Thermosporothrix hazakensis]|jgi:HD superfamily phosphodiesterase|uniref:HD superfamily phosphodiesterase n=2 Tax=Thermosporothrix TaxID=768650 RepID=A0A326UEK4_THEHA|nr:HD domain-containing protein [Thermosporothrix hazakensis]PZW36281.1 HD superfamily phosphodiesterase [Thermosporothrix hazakensis]BBH88747.1 hypothetical protein KTC_34980 [Thermosporothrix sp. COM3]GCE46931.1 hypothetical protein KTH_18000 [Thermosporothrix hazakensis]